MKISGVLIGAIAAKGEDELREAMLQTSQWIERGREIVESQRREESTSNPRSSSFSSRPKHYSRPSNAASSDDQKGDSFNTGSATSGASASRYHQEYFKTSQIFKSIGRRDY